MKYEIRLSRIFTGLLIFGGSLFIAFGIAVMVPNSVFSVNTARWIVGVIFIGLGAIVAYSQIRHFYSAPVMLTVDAQSLSFATNWNYELYSVPLNQIEYVGVHKIRSPFFRWSFFNGPWFPAGFKKERGLIIKFKPTMSDAQLTTPPGMYYSEYMLKLYKPYINQRPRKIAEMITQLLPVDQRTLKVVENV